MFDGKGNFEQIDCVMLSGETSVGSYPDKCVEVLDTVIRRIEKKYPSGRFARGSASY